MATKRGKENKIRYLEPKRGSQTKNLTPSPALKHALRRTEKPVAATLAN